LLALGKWVKWKRGKIGWEQIKRVKRYQKGITFYQELKIMYSEAMIT
jgi:hypothetical protein